MRKRQRSLLLLTGLFGTIPAIGCTSLSDRHDASPVTAPYAVAQTSHEQEMDGSDEDSSLELSDFSISNIGGTVKDLAGKGPDRNVARQLFEEGEQQYRDALAVRAQDPESDYANQLIEASELFVGAAKRWPDSALEEDALFRAGESQFFADHFVECNTLFETLLKKYPNTRYLDLVEVRRFHIADYWMKLHTSDSVGSMGFNFTENTHPWSDTFGHAIRIYDGMRIDDPTGRLADDATMAAANAFFVKGDYLKADQYYSDLRTHFPSSEHQFKAHLLGVQAKLRGYDGPDYAGAALTEAGELLKQIRRQFPKDAKAHAEELGRARNLVRYRMAERKWQLVDYYDRRHEYGAARFYCDAVLKEYGDTPFAAKAREKLGTFSGKPATPPQKLEWLVKLFPDTQSEVPLMATGPSKPQQR